MKSRSSEVVTSRTNMNAHVYSLQFRVLICREYGEFVARALELDLLGYGKTEAEAFDQLKEAVEAQLSFAHQMGDVSLISFRADKEYFDRWEDAQRQALKSVVLGDKSGEVSVKAIVLSFTESELRSLRDRHFRRSDAVCA